MFVVTIAVIRHIFHSFYCECSFIVMLFSSSQPVIIFTNSLTSTERVSCDRTQRTSLFPEDPIEDQKVNGEACGENTSL